jgi:hypothetical protein
MVCKDYGQEPLAITFSRVDEKAPTKKPLTKGAFSFYSVLTEAGFEAIPFYLM